ncbi:serine/threonine protein phosphatase, partial [bacterium]|nr:serine/threonine protein phosphatase [bacterium]
MNEQLFQGLAAEFASVHVENTDAAIGNALKAIGEHVGSDRSYVFVFAADGRTMSNTHEWCAPGIEPQRGNLQDLPIDLFP